MGISGFYAWVTKNYNDAFTTPKYPVFFNHIYFDLNYLLHMCTYNSTTTEMTIDKIKTVITDICSKHHALDSVNICCDGSAPLAKLLLQRRRRLQSAQTMYLENNTDLTNSPLNFTPGSVFMNTIHLKMESLKTKLEEHLNVKVNINNL